MSLRGQLCNLLLRFARESYIPNYSGIRICSTIVCCVEKKMIQKGNYSSTNTNTIHLFIDNVLALLFKHLIFYFGAKMICDAFVDKYKHCNGTFEQNKLGQ